MKHTKNRTEHLNLACAQAAATTPFTESELATVSEESFAEGLGELGLQLLHEGLEGLQEAVARLEPTLSSLAIDAE